MSAHDQWWDDVIKTDSASYYSDARSAARDGKGCRQGSGRMGSFIWGDRVRRLGTQGEAVQVSGRNAEAWVHKRHLGGEPLLEIYVIDVGQGDGLLVVTPEGHHLMVDGGNIRKKQNAGKNAADFVDWKFCKDYVSAGARRGRNKPRIVLDAMIATHNDIDHFGGLWNLLSRDENARRELDASEVTVEALYHAGLSWWAGHDSKGRSKRSLGKQHESCYVQLLGDRVSAVDFTKRLTSPNKQTLSGSWGEFIKAATSSKQKCGRSTIITRVSTATHQFLPGFGPQDPSQCKIRVLGPIESNTTAGPGLKVFPDGPSKNTNGHSIVLRLDYKDRRILLTGDLNTHSQNHIMEHYCGDFVQEFCCDVAKGCHHGSRDVSYRFLEGLKPLCTVISSGDAETHDHPRPTIVAASAITGRRLVDTKDDALIAPLIYLTEVARSVTISRIHSMKEYREPQRSRRSKRAPRAQVVHDTPQEMQRFRLVLGSNSGASFNRPRLDCARAVRRLRYGLINIRTDGKRLFFAQMEESGEDWGFVSLSEEQISEATQDSAR